MGSLRFPRDNPARASRRKENKRGIAGSLRLPGDDPMARYAFLQPDHRASSGSRGSFGYPAMTPHGHRDVSASSFRDGAIPLSYVPKIKTGFALRSQRTRRKNWQGTGFSRKKKGHVGLKSGVPRALPRLRIKNKERIAGHHWLPHDNRLGYQGKNTKVKRPSWQGESRGS